MAKLKQTGFTLIEVILVMAISSSLLLVAFVGQGQLRAQAQFDAAVNKLISSIADAHNEATSGVNVVGTGDGTTACPTSVGTDFVFAGVAWVATGPGDLRMDYYKAIPQSASSADSCIFTNQKISIPAPILVNIASAPSLQGGREIFVRKDNGGLDVCPIPNNTTNVADIFRAGACAEGTLVLTITDGTGRKGQVTIDKSGLAQRNF